MRKRMKKIIEIKKDVKIGNVILEKGDRIKVFEMNKYSDEAFVTIENGQIVGEFQGKKVVINSKEDYKNWAVNIPGYTKTVSISSTLDFPEDETNDPKVIALAAYIRNNS